MSTNATPLSGGNIVVQGAIVDPKTGAASPVFQKWLNDAQTRIQNGLNQLGQLIGQFNGLLASTVKIQGRSEAIAVTVNHIDSTGVVTSAGLTSATSAAQGAVVMPPGAINNHLGGASISAVTDFDAAGAAAAAQTAAQAFATTAANTAQSNAVAISSNAGNISSGTLSPTVIPNPTGGTLGGVKSNSPTSHQWLTSIDSSGNPVTAQPSFSDLSGAITTGQLPGSGLSVTITTAKLTGGGANGSMTFTNGILTAQTPAT